MVNTISKLITASIVTVAMGFMTTASAYAQNDKDCSVKMAGSTDTTGQADSRWTLNNGVVTGKVTITDNDTCNQTVTLVAWQAPNADKGQPYDQQKLVGHVTETFGVGTHSMSIAVPDCFYQIDMVKGSNVTGLNGTAQYPTGSLIGSLHGGTKACDTTTSTPVTPQTPSTPDAPAAPAELVNTGAGSTAFTVALLVTVVGSVGHFLVRRTRLV